MPAEAWKLLAIRQTSAVMFKEEAQVVTFISSEVCMHSRVLPLLGEGV